MHSELEKLLALQTRDLALLDIDRRLDELLAGVQRLDEELEATRSEVAHARAALTSGVKRREEVESKVEGLRVLQERRRQRLEMAKTTRELQALGSELEVARSVLAREETEWFRAADAVSALEREVETASSRLAEVEQSQTETREDLRTRMADLREERQAAQSARESAARELERAVLMRYDRLRQNREAEVVVAVRGDACGACFTAIPMSRRSQLRTGFLLEGCEACGVILYAAESEE